MPFPGLLAHAWMYNLYLDDTAVYFTNTYNTIFPCWSVSSVPSPAVWIPLQNSFVDISNSTHNTTIYGTVSGYNFATTSSGQIVWSQQPASYGAEGGLIIESFVVPTVFSASVWVNSNTNTDCRFFLGEPGGTTGYDGGTPGGFGLGICPYYANSALPTLIFQVSVYAYGDQQDITLGYEVPVSFPVNTWINLIATLDVNGYAALYMNGSLVTSSQLLSSDYLTAWQTAARQPVTIGFNGVNSVNPNVYYNALNGYIQDVLIFNYALNPTQALALYNAGFNDAVGSCQQACLPGTYSLSGYGPAGQCLPCPLNTNTSLYAARQCQACPLGYGTITTSSTSCSACAWGYYLSSNGACIPAPAGSYVSSLTATSPTVCPAGMYQPFNASYGCFSCPIFTTSYANATNCTASCAPNFAVGLQASSQHFVAIDMNSTPVLQSYASNASITNVTVGLWFYPTTLNVSQYLISKYNDWYLLLNSNNQVGVLVEPYMAGRTMFPNNTWTASLYTWSHAAFTVQHSFFFANSSNYNDTNVQRVNTNDSPTYSAAVSAGYQYLCNNVTVMLYINGYLQSFDLFYWATNSSTSLSSSLSAAFTDTIYNNIVASSTSRIQTNSTSINVGTCLMTLVNTSQFLDTPLSSDVNAQTDIACDLWQFMIGNWNGTSSYELSLDRAALMAAYSTYLLTQHNVGFLQYVNQSTMPFAPSDLTSLYYTNYGLYDSPSLTSQINTFIAAATSQYPFLNSSQFPINFGYFDGHIDDVIIFNTVVDWSQMRVLAYQFLLGPNVQAQQVAPILTAIPSIILFLQFEEWLSQTTGTIGTAFLRVQDPVQSRIISAPFHINSGPLCYPLSGASAGYFPSYSAPSFTPSNAGPVVACPAGTSSWPNSIFCYDCPIGYFSNTSGMTSCQLCPPGTSNNQSRSISCPVVAPPGTILPTVASLDITLKQQISTVIYGVLRLGIISSIGPVWTTVSIPGNISSPPNMSIPSIPLLPVGFFYSLFSSYSQLLQQYNYSANADPSFANTEYATAILYSIASIRLFSDNITNFNYSLFANVVLPGAGTGAGGNGNNGNNPNNNNNNNNDPNNAQRFLRAICPSQDAFQLASQILGAMARIAHERHGRVGNYIEFAALSAERLPVRFLRQVCLNLPPEPPLPPGMPPQVPDVPPSNPVRPQNPPSPISPLPVIVPILTIYTTFGAWAVADGFSEAEQIIQLRYRGLLRPSRPPEGKTPPEGPCGNRRRLLQTCDLPQKPPNTPPVPPPPPPPEDTLPPPPPPPCVVPYMCNNNDNGGACPAGTISNITTQMCDPCPDGTYSSSGATACNGCPFGYYCSSPSPSPTPCPTGTYGPALNASSCIDCPNATFANVTGLPYCYVCGANSWTPTGAATACTVCAPKPKNYPGMTLCCNSLPAGGWVSGLSTIVTTISESINQYNSAQDPTIQQKEIDEIQGSYFNLMVIGKSKQLVEFERINNRFLTFDMCLCFR